MFLFSSDTENQLEIQATPTKLTSRISILSLMSKWFFIPNIFSLYIFAFQLRLCRKRLTWSNGYLEVIFHALDIFSKNRLSQGRCIMYMHYLKCENLPNNDQKLLKWYNFFDWTINPLFSAIKSIRYFDTKLHSVLIKCNDIDDQPFTLIDPL